MAYRGRRPFLLKLILTFSVILAISFVVILIFSDAYINKIAVSAAETESVRAVGAMETFFSGKMQAARRYVASLYRNAYYATIPAQMPRLSSLPYGERMQFFDRVDDFLASAMDGDPDIVTIALMDGSGGALRARSTGAASQAALSRALRESLSAREGALPAFGPAVFPVAAAAALEGRPRLLPVDSRVKTTDMKGDAGYLLVDFSCASLDQLLSPYLKGPRSPHLMVLDGNGLVYYDSEHQICGDVYADSPELLQRGAGFFRLGERYARLEAGGALGFRYLCLYPASAIDREAAPQRLLTYLLIALLTGAAILLSALLSRHYYRRIDLLCDAISRIGGGNLGVRALPGGPDDEIRMISDNINVLVDRLRANIEEAYRAGTQSQRDEMLRKDAELKLVNAELYALQTQINPHFLYNALESIRMRALSQGNEGVARMSYILSTLFKYSLKQEYLVCVREEVDMCRLYLELVQIRCPGRFRVEMETPEEIEDNGILRHTLQPILENALTHGLDMTADANKITVAMACREGALEVVISDNGRGMSPEQLCLLRESLKDETLRESHKIGLRNVHMRIIRLFGENYGVFVDSAPDQGTRVCIRLPAMGLEEMKKYVSRADR